MTTPTAASFPPFLDYNERRHSYEIVATGVESLLAQRLLAQAASQAQHVH